MPSERMTIYTGENAYEIPARNRVVSCLTVAIPLSLLMWAVLIFALWNVAPAFARLLLVGLACVFGLAALGLAWCDRLFGSTRCGGRSL